MIPKTLEQLCFLNMLKLRFSWMLTCIYIKKHAWIYCPFRENMWGCCRIWTWKRWWLCVCVFDYLSISFKLFHTAYITIMIYYEYIYKTGRPQAMFSSICAARSNWVGAGQWISMLNMQMTCLGWWCSKDSSHENSGGSELWVVIVRFLFASESSQSTIDPGR